MEPRPSPGLRQIKRHRDLARGDGDKTRNLPEKVWVRLADFLVCLFVKLDLGFKGRIGEAEPEDRLDVGLVGQATLD